MPRCRYDDELPMNRKVARLRAQGVNGLAALGLHLLANADCRHNGTGGHVEDFVPDQLCGPRLGRRLAQILEDVGMFDPHPDGGWEIHDYHEYDDPTDPSPDKSAAERKREISEKRSQAGRLGGLAKAGKRQGVATAKPEQTSSPSPSPLVDENLATSVSQSVGGVGDDDDRVASALMLRAKHVAHRGDDPAAYARTVYRQDVAERGPALRQYLLAHPEATVAELAMRVLGLSEIDVHRLTKEAS